MTDKLAHPYLFICCLAVTASCEVTYPEGRFECESEADCPPKWFCWSDELCRSTEEPPGTSDPCQGVICKTPPAARCSGDRIERIWYDAVGSCSSSTGGCTYQQHDETCEHGCEDATCLHPRTADAGEPKTDGGGMDGSEVEAGQADAGGAQECPGGFGNCDGDASNGCETKLDTLTDCGDCGQPCDGVSCAGGVCTDLTCKRGYADCDGKAGNGCEKSLTSLTDCVMCKIDCYYDNAVADCSEGSCEFVRCSSGYDDCDKDLSNGCETELGTVNACGGCGDDCTALDRVDQVSCEQDGCHIISCASDYMDCDENPFNGCETPLDTFSDCGAWPSCAVDQPGADRSCGPGGDEDCCASPLVTGGTYYRSSDAVDYRDESNPATVSDFRLDRFEVTVGRFRAFVEASEGTQVDPPQAGAGVHPFNPASGWDESWNSYLAVDALALSNALLCDSIYGTWTPTAGANEQLPINCVNWYEAFAFCAWDGGWLPTESEWNYAAGGGAEQRFYPWSSPAKDITIDGTYAVYHCIGDGSAMDDCGFSDIRSVGSRSPKGDGLWGQADLGGSMLEWNLDLYDTYVNPCDNCTNLTVASNRVLRGGGWTSNLHGLRSSYRNSHPPTTRYHSFGFRCARTP